jgi:molecular chaperone HscC
MTRSGALVGIDLGTTYSLIATLDGGKPIVLGNSLGEVLTPSAVSITPEGIVLVGAAARARASLDPEHTALAFKRDMGTDRVYDLGGRRMRPEELSALVLGELKNTAESALGKPLAEAVVTVPAYFGELQRRATRDACELAGLSVERIINEPTAAALAYGLHERKREFRGVVLDLGGGTFDVTVLEVMEGVIEIQASAGDTRLGGEDFTAALVEHAAARIAERHGADPRREPLARARLYEACERAKLRLSSAERAAIVVPELGIGGRRIDVEVVIDLEAADVLWEPLFERMRLPIRRAMRDAGAATGQIEEVLLVGGATRMPSVGRLAAQLFGRLPLRKLPPDEAVALGAAVQVGLKAGDHAVADMVVTDVAPFTLGVSVCAGIGQHHVSGLFEPILERGTVLPASRIKSLSTLEDGQKIMLIEVFQGEHSLCRDNQRLGEYKITGIPAGPAGTESIDVRFTYDLNGVLDVDMTVTATKKTHTLTIERSPGKLTPDQLREARKRLQALKFHPQDALPNVTALARAEALHVQCTGLDRELLAGAIGAFRLALESQDPQLIAERRAVLLRAIDQLRNAEPRF